MMKVGEMSLMIYDDDWLWMNRMMVGNEDFFWKLDREKVMKMILNEKKWVRKKRNVETVQKYVTFHFMIQIML